MKAIREDRPGGRGLREQDLLRESPDGQHSHHTVIQAVIVIVTMLAILTLLVGS